MNTEAHAQSGENGATTSKDTARRGPRIVARTALLAVGLLAAAAGVFYLADTLRGIILDMASAERGEWASLLGGGLGVWAFFLIRSGIIGHAFDLVPKTKQVLESLPVPQWSTFLESTYDLSRTLVMPGLVTVFALVFVGQHVRDQVIDPPPSAVARQIDELRLALDSRLDAIESNIGDDRLQAALDAQGYTPERAQRLDRVGVEEARSDDDYFARFPITFEAGALNGDGTAFDRGTDYDPADNSHMVTRLVNALIPCGAVEDPVTLRVEGYASSEPFRNAAASVTSEALNLRLAHERRRSVKAALDAAVMATGAADARRRLLVMEAEDYRTIADMEADRQFNDRPAGGDANPLAQDFLTRAAHIKVMSPGTCRVRSE